MRRCKLCGCSFKQRKSESNYAFQRRLTCSTRCFNQLFKRDLAPMRSVNRVIWESAGRVLAGKEKNDE